MAGVQDGQDRQDGAGWAFEHLQRTVWVGHKVRRQTSFLAGAPGSGLRPLLLLSPATVPLARQLLALAPPTHVPNESVCLPRLGKKPQASSLPEGLSLSSRVKDQSRTLSSFHHGFCHFSALASILSRLPDLMTTAVLSTFVLYSDR